MTSYLREIKEELEDDFFEKKNVIGVGIGKKEVNGEETDRESIICYVTQKEDAVKLDYEDLVSSLVVDRDVETDVKEIGIPKAESEFRKEKHRPSPCGVSIGHYKITSGTQGFVVNTEKGKIIISNNHVLANSNKGNKGDPILQQGPYDGGNIKENTIAKLRDYEDIVFEDVEMSSLKGLIEKISNWGSKIKNRLTNRSDNLVDCAIAKPLLDADVTEKEYGLFEPLGFTDNIKVGDKVVKSGRTTGISEGKIKDLDATIKVRYGNKIAKFKDQIILTDMSEGGDSGSAIIKKPSKKICGLLFAGSDKVTIANKIENVEGALGLDLIPKVTN